MSKPQSDSPVMPPAEPGFKILAEAPFAAAPLERAPEREEELTCGTYFPRRSLFFAGVYALFRGGRSTEHRQLLCDRPTAVLVDTVLARIRTEGPAAIPNHFRARRALIESGSRYCLGSPEPRFTAIDDWVCAAIHRRAETGSRLWVPFAHASDWALGAIVAQVLERRDAPAAAAPGPKRYGVSLVFGTPARRDDHGLALNGDNEAMIEAEEFPKYLLERTQILAWRLDGSASPAPQSEEAA